jgi:hypothetical protein
MANNLFAEVPAACVATQTVSFVAAGFTELNTRVIYEIGNPIKSWKPNRTINAITSFTAGKGYYIIPMADMDKEAYLAPPITEGGEFNTEFA